MPRLGLLFGLLVCSSGCPSISSTGLARPVPVGQTQVQMTSGGTALQDVRVREKRRVTLVVPNAEFVVRRGVSERLELDGKLWCLGLELGGKYALHRAGSTTAGTDVSVAPSISLYPFLTDPNAKEGGTAILSYVHLPVLIGLNTSGGHQLVVAPRLSGLTYMGRGMRPREILAAGGNLGMAFRVGPGARVMPELTLMMPVVSRLRTSERDFGPYTRVFQLNVAYLFGGD